ncbi:MAG: transposase [Patescibacteria group bacterium]
MPSVAAISCDILYAFMTQRHPVQNDVLMLVTTVTANREPVFANPAYAREAIECLYRVQKQRPFLLYGFVIMPDHCHFLLFIPPPESISKIMNSYKSGLTFDLGLSKIWQPRFHVRLPDNAEIALRYIHENPVKAELVSIPEDYPWSSASGEWLVETA